MKSPTCFRAPALGPRPLRTVLVLTLFGIAAVGQAASAIWKTTAADGNWSNGANWLAGHPPNSGDDLTFPVSSSVMSMNNDLTAGTNFSAITFEGAGYTLAGNGIGVGEILCGSGVAGINTLSFPMNVTSTIVVGTPAGCTLDLEGAITGSGGILATGGGPVVLGGADTYTGTTTAGATSGILVVNGTLSGTSSVTVSESSGDVALHGHGTFTAPLNVNNAFPTDTAVVAPGQGASTGILSTGDATFGGSGSRTTLAVKINGTTAGTDYDQLSVTGSVTLTHVFLDVSLSYTPAAGDSFTIVKINIGGGVVAGQFIGLADGAKFLARDTVSGAWTWLQIHYPGGGSSDVVLTAIDPGVTPLTLDVDADGNGVLEVGELALIQPAWCYLGSGNTPLDGTTSNFTGPAQSGTLFTNPDSDNQCGVVSQLQCVACTLTRPSVQITAPGRPAQHWDTRIDETMNPFSVIKTWTLHVGESFPDVTTSHQFYKFVENLFHNGVTGGCAGGNYCPANAVTRAQMAVFLLKGEHGGSYLPPACSSTMFTDVPCPGGGFVDWINQLASENITGGCGGGKYCPGNPVNRGQMAVFLLKGEHGGAYAPPACAATVFTDVVCPGAQFVNFINQLAAENITGGCGGGLYCPGNPVNRGQMAAFLVKTFALLLYGP